ncbi:hypothetical protein AAS21_gp193 [Pantoea phage vB_PagS_AAS21]|uniref:Uncharacterized protein n=1 Tax=Pantoea phage vB_PagS_AAS21 TaxID=2575261 RepID=A0A4Y5P1U0_9CAUD|nr:hypothetical protein AAS21_gp193 [Pantoea phage vB_PagS_AAS21]
MEYHTKQAIKEWLQLIAAFCFVGFCYYLCWRF